MAQPLLATHRIEFAYTVQSILHVQRGYCALGTPVAGVQKIVLRDGVTTEDFPVIAQAAWDILRTMLYTPAPAPVVTLQTLTGVVWNPISVTTPTGVGTSTAYAPASQLTVVVRDTAFKKIRLNLMEGSAGYIGHSATGLGLSGAIDAWVNNITGNDADPSGYYQWLKSRGNRYILGVGSIAGATLDLNDKIKRSRHLE